MTTKVKKTIHLIRHGESTHNGTPILSPSPSGPCPRLFSLSFIDVYKYWYIFNIIWLEKVAGIPDHEQVDPYEWDADLSTRGQQQVPLSFLFPSNGLYLFYYLEIQYN